MKNLRYKTTPYFRLIAIIMLALSVGTPTYGYAQGTEADSFKITLIDATLSPAANPPGFTYETSFSTGWLDEGTDIAVDADGNAYVLTQSYTNDHDVYVSKLAPDGSVVFSVLLGGSDFDIGSGIALDGQGSVLVAGWTDSPDFPLMNPIQSSLNGFRDAFITRLSASDGSLLYSSYLGGDYVDQAEDIALSSSGEIYLVGKTESSDFPTVNGYQGELNSSPYQFADAFITRLSADGSQVLYSTYLGGTNDDEGQSIAVGNNGEIYISGDTKSSDFPLQSPVQGSFAGGERDIFVSKLSADSSSLEFSTYLGGEDWDCVGRLDLDTSDNPVIAGTTRSIGYPTTPGAFQETFVGEILGCEVPFGGDQNCYDIFVSKLASDGSSLNYSTFIGGIRDEEARGVSVDADGSVLIAGYTFSPDYPPNGIDYSAEIVLSKLSPDGSSLEYSVTVDSGSANAGHGVALDGAGGIYLAGAVNVPADTYVGRLSESATLPPPPPPPADTVHVESIDLQVRERNGRYLLTTRVTIMDGTGQPMQGAEVTIGVTDPSGRMKSTTDQTDSSGIAQFRSRHRTGGTWQVCVSKVDMLGYTYDPSQNVETCDTITYP